LRKDQNRAAYATPRIAISFRALEWREEFVTTYTFTAVVEPDEERWYAYCPALVRQGGASWGETRAEALANLEQIVRMVVASMIEHGEPIIDGAPKGTAQVFEEPLVAVTV
jgi:predicted RNase H-like HicB family nuclease